VRRSSCSCFIGNGVSGQETALLFCLSPQVRRLGDALRCRQGGEELGRVLEEKFDLLLGRKTYEIFAADFTAWGRRLFPDGGDTGAARLAAMGLPSCILA
jgi:hypothetical protein